MSDKPLDQTDADNSSLAKENRQLRAKVTRLQQGLHDIQNAWKEVEHEPYGCPACDSGKLRYTEKPHWTGCGFALMRTAIASLIGPEKESKP